MPRINQALEAMARQRPDQIAVIDRGATLSYAQLSARVLRAAAWLHRAGLRPGDMVGFSVRAELPRLVLQLGLMRLGCTSVTLASFEPLEARADLARRCGAVAVVTDRDIPHPDGLSVIAPDLDAIRTDAALETAGRALPQPDGTASAIVLTSSGTTGLPKLIRRTQAQLFDYPQAEWPLRPHYVLGRYSPAEANVWTWGVLCNLVRGRTLAFLEYDRTPFVEACRRLGVTKTFVWPAALPDLIAQCSSAPEGSPLRDACVLTGGSEVDAQLQREVIAHVTPHFVLQYGATETGTVAWMPADPDRFDGNAVGYAMPGIELGVFDDAGRSLPPGVTGYLRIRSPWIATEYWQDPEATARAFIDGWWQPGDLGRLDEHGLLIVPGRSDDMMMMNSINIFPTEIERVAATFAGVRACAAFPVATPRYGQLPVLAVVADPGFATAALLAFCRQRLGVRAPRKVILVDDLPRNSAGKVLRKDLAQRYVQSR